jgi:rod shape-determining protein MreC
MPARRWLRFTAGGSLLQAWPWAVLLVGLAAVRLSKGALGSDAYALLSRPFWTGTAQADWLRSARRFEDRTRVAALEAENARLRGLVGLRSWRASSSWASSSASEMRLRTQKLALVSELDS